MESPHTQSSPGGEHSRAYHLAVALTFCAVIFAPWLDPRPVSERSPELAEKRPAAPPPEFSLDVAGLNAFPRAMEDHFDDTFGFRDWFLRGHSIVHLFGFGATPTPSVLVGKEGWLFFTGASTIEDYRGLESFTPELLAGWQKMLEQRRDVLAGHGAHYVFVLVPNKEEMYPEHMPDHLVQLGERRIDQFVEHMRAHSDLDLLDLRDAFRAARAGEDPELPLYVKLGTHWNGPGSVVAARAIVEHVAQRHPELTPVPEDELVRLEMPTHGDSWGTSMYIDDLLPQRIVSFRPPEGSVEMIVEQGRSLGSDHVLRGPDPELPRAVLVHDSFGPYLWPLLAWSFSELHCLWRGPFPYEEVRAARPDIVIEERVQRSLIQFKPQPLPAQDHESAFLAAGPPLLELEFPAADGSVEARGNLERAPSTAAGREGLEITANSRRDLLALPAVDAGEGGRLVLRVEYWSSGPGRLGVFHAEGDEERPALSSGSRIDLKRGPGAVHVAFDVPAGVRRVFLRPPARPASLVLRRLELRRAAP